MDDIMIDTARKEAEEIKKGEGGAKASSPSFWDDRIKKKMGEPSSDASKKPEWVTAHRRDKPEWVTAHRYGPGDAREKLEKKKQEIMTAPQPKDTIENSVEAQANAKPGDVVNGKALTQGDINWAKEQMVKNQDTQTAEEDDVSVSGGIEGSNINAPEIVEATPDLNAPEVQKAIGAGGAEIEDAEGDESKQDNFKQKYCNAIWENFDEGMNHQPQFKPGWQLPATILSIGLSVFTGGLVPPVNFMKLTGKEEAYSAAMDMWKEAMGSSKDLATEKQRASEMPTAKAEGMEAAKDVASQEAIDQAAEVNAAERGAQADARLGTEGDLEVMNRQAEIDYAKLDKEQAHEMALKRLEQIHEQKLKNMDAGLARDLAKFTADSQMALQQAAATNDLDKIRELYKEAVNQQGDTLRALGYDVDPDGYLEYMRNTGATSNAQARIRQALDIVDTGVNAIGTVGGVISDMQGNAINAASSILPML